MPAKKTKPASKARKRSTVAKKTASIRKPAKRVRARVAKKKVTTRKTVSRKRPVRQSLIQKEDLATIRQPQLTPRKVVRPSSPVPDADVPTPAQTSSHGPFDERSRRDPDRIPGGEGILNEQFAEEDHLTNKTGNPRIGTRGRKF